MSGEFAAIDAIRGRLPGPAEAGEVWIGDDAAVLRGYPGWMLFAADTAVGGVHADLGLTGLGDLGWKAVAASISDIAAMGGEPGHALVTVSAPPGTSLPEIYDGVAAAAERFGCPVVGGDLTNARDIVVTVAVTGHCDGPPVLRRGARPGDLIWVTGPLGASAAGLRLLRQGRTGASAALLGPERCRLLVEAHARPVPRLDLGRAARVAGATAMIDVSDGLSADLGHVADQSGVGIRLETIPVAEGATLDEALGGGEDYALAFCAPESADLESAFSALDHPVLVGRCVEDPHERSLAGKRLEPTGWQHRW